MSQMSNEYSSIIFERYQFRISAPKLVIPRIFVIFLQFSRNFMDNTLQQAHAFSSALKAAVTLDAYASKV
jgi:hypothetical protein